MSGCRWVKVTGSTMLSGRWPIAALCIAVLYMVRYGIHPVGLLWGKV